MIKTLRVFIHSIGLKASSANFPAGTWRPREVTWMSSKSPNIQHLDGIFREPIQKLLAQWKQWFLKTIVLALHIYPCFLKEEQIFKSSKRGHPRDVSGHPGDKLWDIPGTKWWDVLGTPAGRRSNMFFKFNSQTH